VPYRWNELSFDVPDGRDDTAIIVVDRADPPGWNLTVRKDALPSAGKDAFEAWVKELKTPHGVVKDDQIGCVVAGHRAVVVTQHLRAERQMIRQWQASIDAGDHVVLVTVSAREASQIVAKKAFDALLLSLHF
jgi:hypothetical protein